MPKTISTNNTDLTRDKRYTFLSEDVIAVGTTIRVQSLLGFHSLDISSGQIICIGEIGNERTEILRTSNSAVLGTTYREVTLRDSLGFDHSQDTKVYIIDWNRVEFTTAATVSGTKSTLRAYPLGIDADHLETSYRDTTQTAGYYFTRFNESIANGYSDYSDPIPFAGFDDNTVFMIKKRALDAIGEEIDGKVITHEFLNEALWEGRREYHKAPGKRPFRKLFNLDIGNVLTGSYRIELPVTVEKPFTAENIYGVRIGVQPNMGYYDKKEWDFDYRNVGHSTLTSAYATDSRDLYLASTRDFTGSGVVSVEGTNVEYSAKSISGGTLRISVQGSYAASAGSDIWQNVSYGLPDKFTVWADAGGSAYIYFNRPFSTTYIDQNIYADIYRTLLGYDSDADILDEPEYDMYVPYLQAKIKHRKNKGMADITQDSDYKLWTFKKSNALANEYLSTQIRIEPDVSHLTIPQ